MKEIPDEWVKRADDLTEEQKKEFIVKDNVGFGEWDWDALANDWSEEDLSEWGVDIPMFDDLGDNNESSGERGGHYNDEEKPEIEPYKAMYRVEAISRVKRGKCIELFSGQGALTYWYKRSFDSVITNDVQGFNNCDYAKKAINFINSELKNHIDFDFIDFDDEGCPILIL